ncbi:MAG: flagellar hook-length control protein FliK [Halanaerobiaceae bacterium]
MVSRIDQVIKIELEKIMRDNQSLINENLSTTADKGGEEIQSAVDNLINSFAELSPENQKIFFQSWLASELPLDPELIVPLIEFISENPDSNIQRLLIESAAFLNRNNLPVRKFFLEALGYENQPPENFNINNLSDLIEIFSEGNISKLLARSDNLSSATGIALLNQVSNLNEKQQLLLYIEMPLFINSQRETADRLYLRITKDTQDYEEDKNKGYQLSFIIDLSESSTVKADIKILNRRINASFLTTNNKLKEAIEANMNHLRENISKLNYSLASVDAKTIEEIDNLKLREEIITENIDLKNDSSFKEIIKRFQHIDIKA